MLWKLLAIILCLKILRPLVTQTMFFDGLIYASVARNMADGTGSPWRPAFSQALFPLFAEHPPLAMWLQAVAFRAFGDTTWIEKSYSLLTALLSGLIMLGIWRRLTEKDLPLRSAGILALIFSLIAGRLSWAYANNMLENTLIVFTSTPIWLIVEAYSPPCASKFTSRLPYMIVAGALTFLAIITKGPVGLFPLAAPVLFSICFGRPSVRTAAVDTAIMVTVAAGMLALLLLDPEAGAYADRYLHYQLFASLAGERGGTSGGWHGLWSLFRVNFFPLLLAALILSARLYSRHSRPATACISPELRQKRYRNAAFLFAIGLSASLPLLVSPRLNSFYFNPSIPYFAAAAATISAPVLLSQIRSLNEVRLRRLNLLMLAGMVAAALSVILAVGKTGSDKIKIADAQKIADHICSVAGRCQPIVAACGSVGEDWQLHAYLERYYHVSLKKDDLSVRDDTPFLLVSHDCPTPSSTAYHDIDARLSSYRLFRHI
ncbi:ArnT family glycosyltransferase [Rhizobium sp.]|uniref:ArnT family glycosyltransferase n=1 Tax=Rhizobium sp. TaxID=391 RepID=UPI002F08393E